MSCATLWTRSTRSNSVLKFLEEDRQKWDIDNRKLFVLQILVQIYFYFWNVVFIFNQILILFTRANNCRITPVNVVPDRRQWNPMKKVMWVQCLGLLCFLAFGWTQQINFSISQIWSSSLMLITNMHIHSYRVLILFKWEFMLTKTKCQLG